MIKFNLGVLLAERNLNINKVHKDTGLSRITLSSISNNNGQGIQLDTINKLCQYLKITPGELFIYVPFDINFFISSDEVELEVIHNNKKITYTFGVEFDVDYIKHRDEFGEIEDLEPYNITVNTWAFDEYNEVDEEEKEAKKEVKKYLDMLPVKLYNQLENEIYHRLNENALNKIEIPEDFIDLLDVHNNFSLDDIFKNKN